ncbi:hypothetical protein JCM10213_005124, partial [Rhodosporidiobolus nylandii]
VPGSRDVVAVDVTSESGAVRVFSVYNPCTTAECVPLLSSLLPPPPSSPYLVISGDFNAHHPLWDPSRAYATAEASAIADLLRREAPEMLLPPGTVTRYGTRSGTAIDLVAGNAATAERVLRCSPSVAFDSNSDHLPLLTVLDIRPLARKPEQRPNFKLLDPEKLCTAYLAITADRQPLLPSFLSTASKLDEAVEAVTEDVLAAVKAAVPPLRAYKKAVPWWSVLLSRKVREVRKAQNFARSHPEDPHARLRFQNARRGKKAALKRAKREYHESILSQIKADTLWPSLRRLEGRAGASIPPLRDGDNGWAVSASEKENLLHRTLIPSSTPRAGKQTHQQPLPRGPPPPPSRTSARLAQRAARAPANPPLPPVDEAVSAGDESEPEEVEARQAPVV